MKNLLKKWIFIAQFHLQDPDSEYESGSSLAICIRIHPVPDPQHCWYLYNIITCECWVTGTFYINFHVWHLFFPTEIIGSPYNTSRIFHIFLKITTYFRWATSIGLGAPDVPDGQAVRSPSIRTRTDQSCGLSHRWDLRAAHSLFFQGGFCVSDRCIFCAHNKKNLFRTLIWDKVR